MGLDLGLIWYYVEGVANVVFSTVWDTHGWLSKLQM